MIERDKQSVRSLEQPTPAEPESIQAAAGRRRFLKGLGIGLPAIMTLRSGALLAATSSQCAAYANTHPSTSPAKFSKTDDGWFRSQGMKKPENATYNKEYYKYTTPYNDKNVYDPPYDIKPLQVFKNTPAAGSCYDLDGSSPPTFSPSSILIKAKDSDNKDIIISHPVVCDDYTSQVQGDGPYYALCYVNDKGVVQSCSPSDTGNPVSQSCALNSFTN